MRTTIELDENNLREAKRRARAASMSLGALLGKLVEQALAPTQAPLQLVSSGRFQVAADNGAGSIDPARVRSMIEDDATD